VRRKFKNVNFFTNETNVSFVYNEILNLAEYFEEVKVFAFKTDPNMVFPDNVRVESVDYSNYSVSKILFNNLFLFTRVAFLEIIKAPRYLINMSSFRYVMNDLMRCFYLANELSKNTTLQERETLNYTFWFNQWATVLSILKKKNVIGKYYSRAHGTDLYEERVPKMKRIAFRWFQLKYVSKVFSVSKMGASYLNDKYPSYSDKIAISYLGTKNKGFSTFDEMSVFTIVSCANVRNIKRIHLIPAILEYLDFELQWIHIGSESPNSKDASVALYRTNKLKLTEFKNVSTLFLGAISNKEVLEFYKNKNVNLYISVSETEGLPVSMMEVISFGIPILSTDVGGCSEIVNAQTGILIPKDFNPIKVAQQIKQFRNSKLNTTEFRNGVRNFWEKNFDGNRNFSDFVNMVSFN
jgi:glycosyltransferase involved in cell wall biosynthesis